MDQARTVLITGASKRIGKAIALTLAQQGWDIALHYNHSRDAAEETCREIEALGRRCTLFACDLGDASQVRELIPAVMDSCPECCGLVNNASIFERAPFLDTTEEFFDRHFDLNFRTPFFMTQAFARCAKTGVVINLLDTKIEQRYSNYFAYLLTKKALFEFTRMAAHELAPGIRVNGVCPGLILPPPGEDVTYMLEMQDRIPAKRHGSAQDIADAVRFLVESEFITGEWIFVDGGEHLTK